MTAQQKINLQNINSTPSSSEIEQLIQDSSIDKHITREMLKALYGNPIPPAQAENLTLDLKPLRF